MACIWYMAVIAFCDSIAGKQAITKGSYWPIPQVRRHPNRRHFVRALAQVRRQWFV